MNLEGAWRLGLDPRNPRWRERLRVRLAELLGQGPGQIGADGLKLDFTGPMTTPSPLAGGGGPLHGYAHLHALYRVIAETARAVRPDGLLDFPCAHPQFAAFHDSTRLNDLFLPRPQALRVMEIRARIARAASLGALVVRVIDREKMPGRLSAITSHPTDPAHKVYCYTQECSLFEVDVNTLEPTLLFHTAVPGWHSKGAYTAQGILVVSHNGEEPGPSPYWEVDYADLPKTVREVERLLQTPATCGPEDWGVLAEWDGRDWTVISRRQHVEVLGPGGLHGAADPDEPIWAQGWDRRSVLLNVRHAGRWHRYRLSKGSYTYDGYNGSYTEWPRIREIGNGRWLMTMHGTFYEFPPGFRPGHTGDLVPLCTYQRYLPGLLPLGR